jgi:hypothetical protein
MLEKKEDFGLIETARGRGGVQITMLRKISQALFWLVRGL